MVNHINKNKILLFFVVLVLVLKRQLACSLYLYVAHQAQEQGVLLFQTCQFSPSLIVIIHSFYPHDTKAMENIKQHFGYNVTVLLMMWLVLTHRYPLGTTYIFHYIAIYCSPMLSLTLNFIICNYDEKYKIKRQVRDLPKSSNTIIFFSSFFFNNFRTL